MMALVPICSRETPRQILAEDFKDSCRELPIRGGWGYTKDDACVIDKNDPIVNKSVPFNGIGIEYLFVEKRIYEEMIIFRPKEEWFAGIQWNLERQNLVIEEDGKAYDQLIFTITAFRDVDYEELKAEFEGLNGYETPGFDLGEHERKRSEKMISITREFWFDITTFYMK
jgi:hypothetical protein